MPSGTGTQAWADPSRDAVRLGFRVGSRGTHGSRTIMLSELAALLATLPEDADAGAAETAIVAENCLGKDTASTRRMSLQRLRELYGLAPRIPLYRALRRAWNVDPHGRPLLAILAALARDPLLRATAPVVLDLQPGDELGRRPVVAALREATQDRLSDAVLDKVARNAASSWAQAGHLHGRVRKLRRTVQPSSGAVALACWLGSAEGLAGEALLRSRWVRVLDATGRALEPHLVQARHLGLVAARLGGGIVEIDPRPLALPQGRT
jgi:hypothetical protein